MIKAVFLDFYNTLARFQPAKEELQIIACESVGVYPTLEGILDGYNIADAHMDRENSLAIPLANRSVDQQREFFSRYQQLILQGAGIEVNIDVAAQIWEALTRLPYGLALYGDVLPALEILKSKGITLAILSNINRDLAKLSRELGLGSYIDFIVTSGEVGLGKPHPLIFSVALERAGVESHEAFHVGDSYLSDVKGARSAGIFPLLLTRDENSIEPLDCVCIDSLDKIEEHLDLH